MRIDDSKVPRKPRIAWFVSDSRSSLLKSQVFTKRMLRYLQKDFEVDLFTETARFLDCEQSVEIFHFLQFPKRLELSRYSSLVFLIEDRTQCSFIYRFARLYNGLSLLFDQSFNQMHFEQMSQASIGKVFDDFADSRGLESKFYFGDFRDRDWDISVFKKTVSSSVEDQRLLSNTASLVPGSLDSFDFPIENDVETVVEGDRKTIVSVYVSSFLEQRALLCLETLSKLREHFDFSVELLVEDQNEVQKVEHFLKIIAPRYFLSGVGISIIDVSSLEKLTRVLRKSSLLISLGADESLSCSMSLIRAIEIGLPAISHSTELLKSIANSSCILVRPGLDEGSALYAATKALLSVGRRPEVEMPIADGAACYEKIKTLILREENCSVRLNDESKMYSEIVNSRRPFCEKRVFEVAQNDFGW